MSKTSHPLTMRDQRLLLEVAREAAMAALKHSAPCHEAGQHVTVTQPVAGRYGGAFVTLWREGTLRGCIGRFVETEDVLTVVREAAGSAVRDSRFVADPVTIEELAGLALEVSVLSLPRRIEDPLLIRIGLDGIIVRSGERTGCFLPKVAAERAWSAEQFLSECCCQKAGLPADAWRSAETLVLVFTAQAFSSSELT